VGVRHDAGGLARAGHPGLVEDQDRRTRPETAPIHGEVEDQPRQRECLADTGLLAELPDRSPRWRDPQHAIAAGRIRLGEQAGGERLARPGERLDRLDTVTARRHATDDDCLIGGRRERRVRQHRVYHSVAFRSLPRDGRAPQARFAPRWQADRSW
jgi:hypothetical protein